MSCSWKIMKNGIHYCSKFDYPCSASVPHPCTDDTFSCQNLKDFYDNQRRKKKEESDYRRNKAETEAMDRQKAEQKQREQYEKQLKRLENWTFSYKMISVPKILMSLIGITISVWAFVDESPEFSFLPKWIWLFTLVFWALFSVQSMGRCFNWYLENPAYNKYIVLLQAGLATLTILYAILHGAGQTFITLNLMSPILVCMIAFVYYMFTVGFGSTKKK